MHEVKTVVGLYAKSVLHMPLIWLWKSPPHGPFCGWPGDLSSGGRCDLWGVGKVSSTQCVDAGSCSAPAALILIRGEGSAFFPPLPLLLLLLLLLTAPCTLLFVL